MQTPQTYVDDDEEEMILDIVARYAAESAVDEAQKDEDEMLLLQVAFTRVSAGRPLPSQDADNLTWQVEHMKRELAMFHAAQAVHKQLMVMDDQLDRMALAVLPPEERLPKPTSFGGKEKSMGLANQIRGLLRCVFLSSLQTQRMLPKTAAS